MTEKRKTSNGSVIKNCILSLCINGIIAAGTIALTNMRYGSNDDYVISQYIGDGYPYAGFVNYYLCRILIAVQSHVAEINVYVIFLIIVSFFSLFYITWIIFNRCSNIWLRLMLVAFLVVYSFDHYCAIQFTKVAALVGTVGFIVLADSVIEKKGIAAYIVSFLLIYTAVGIRYEALPGLLGMAVVSAAAWMFTDRKKYKKEERLSKRKIISTAVILALVAGTFGFIELSHIQNTSTPELRYYDEYGLYRTNIVDYPTFEYYEQNKDQYDVIGISEDDMFLISKWYFDYDGAATLDNMRKIDGIERPLPSYPLRAAQSIEKALRCVYEGVRDLKPTGIHIVLLIILAAGMFLTLKPRHWLYVLIIGCAAFGLYTALYFTQRANYRAFYVADTGATFWLMYYYASAAGRFPNEFREKLAVVPGIMLITISLLFTYPLVQYSKDKSTEVAGKTMTEEESEYFLARGTEAFVWETNKRKNPRRYTSPWLLPDNSDRNVFSTGGWEVLSPYKLEQLSEYGMHNPIKDLINNENAYYIGNRYTEKLARYYEKWYAENNETVRLEQVDTVGGFAVWKVIME